MFYSLIKYITTFDKKKQIWRPNFNAAQKIAKQIIPINRGGIRNINSQILKINKIESKLETWSFLLWSYHLHYVITATILISYSVIVLVARKCTTAIKSTTYGKK